MPRKAREKSESGIYHIMLRGINQQQIFEDDEDKEKFIQILKDCKAISGFELYAYCLMSNHFHLLIKVGKEDLEKIFKRIGGRYVYWYNIKYKRTGHLFQDRYKSEPVEDDEYLLTVTRYIHQNPVKAGITKKINYKFSSYNAYIKDDKIFVNTEMILSMISKKQFIEYNDKSNMDICLDMDKNNQLRLTDEQAKEVILKVSKCSNVSEFQALDVIKKVDCLKELKNKGLSIRQISRLTGTSIGIVRKY